MKGMKSLGVGLRLIGLLGCSVPQRPYTAFGETYDLAECESYRGGYESDLILYFEGSKVVASEEVNVRNETFQKLCEGKLELNCADKECNVVLEERLIE